MATRNNAENVRKSWRSQACTTIIAALWLAMFCTGAHAQSGAGSIQGTVQDSTGAVIANATITVVQQGTNATFNTKSNESGFYQVPALFTGTYSVTIAAPGMKTYRTSIELLVAQAAVINPVMTAGAVTQQIEVEANTVQLTTTDNGTIASTLENQRINQLPMNGRDLISLVGTTTPGVENGGQMSNGLMSEALEYVADGVPLSNRQFGGEGGIASSNFSGQAQTPDPDSIQEVRVETTNSGAQYSEPGTVIVTTKSGTNSLHGALFETARNNAIGIAKARQNPSNYAAPHYVRNEFGVSVGGPIILPKVYHGKDKSFFFVAYERYSLASANTELVTVPTAAMRTGDFSGLINSSGNLQQLYDPATTQSSANCNGTGVANQYCRTPFPNNQIPINRRAPAAKMINDITAQSNLSYNPLVQSNLQAVNPVFQVIPTWTFRLDHAINENNRAYVRFTSVVNTHTYLRNNGGNYPATVAADGFPAWANGVMKAPQKTYGAGIGYTHVFSPTFYAETIVSEQWFDQYFGSAGPNLDYEAMLGTPNNFGALGMPIVSGIIATLSGTQTPHYGQSQTVNSFDENLTKIVGKHQINFGGRYRLEQFKQGTQLLGDTISSSNQATGLYQVSSGTNYSTTPNTGYSEGDFFLGAASTYSINQQPPHAHLRDMEVDAYIQDNYHVSKSLTLNLGLRYEAHPATWVGNNLMNSFDLKNDAVVLAAPPATLIAQGATTQALINNMLNIGAVFETPEQAGMPATTLMRNYNLTVGPRVGLAYTPFGGKYGTVIRGAYGRYTYPLPIRSYLALVMRNNPLTSTYSRSYTSANQSPDSLPNYLLRNPQTVIMGTNSSNVVDSSSSSAILPGVSNTYSSPAMSPDYVTQMNFTIEQQLKGNSAFRVTYLWSHGTNLARWYSFNAPPSNFVWETAYGIVPPTGSTIGSNQYAATATGPYDQKTWGSSIWTAKDGWSNDNALQVTYQRIFHHGIAYQINYVRSKAMRFGGSIQSDPLSTQYPAANYLGVLGSVGSWSSPYGTVITPALPPARPAGTLPWQAYHALSRYEGYQVDTYVPKQHIAFNGIVDLPFGREKRFFGNANHFMNELVGGFQIAGAGNIVSQNFAVTNTNWGPTNSIKIYKHKAPITDCRTGTCLKEFLWFNGYLSPAVINASTKGVSGLPSDYAAYQSPIDTTVGTANFNTNNVLVTLSNGNKVTTAFSPGPMGANPYSHTILDGPINCTVDLSVFKVFPITESSSLRFNADAFNALNVQGFNNPNATDGTQVMSSSYNTPRQIQFTLRLQF